MQFTTVRLPPFVLRYTFTHTVNTARTTRCLLYRFAVYTFTGSLRFAVTVGSVHIPHFTVLTFTLPVRLHIALLPLHFAWLVRLPVAHTTVVLCGLRVCVYTRAAFCGYLLPLRLRYLPPVGLRLPRFVCFAVGCAALPHHVTTSSFGRYATVYALPTHHTAHAFCGSRLAVYILYRTFAYGLPARLPVTHTIAAPRLPHYG